MIARSAVTALGALPAPASATHTSQPAAPALKTPSKKIVPLTGAVCLTSTRCESTALVSRPRAVSISALRFTGGAALRECGPASDGLALTAHDEYQYYDFRRMPTQATINMAGIGDCLK